MRESFERLEHRLRMLRELLVRVWNVWNEGKNDGQCYITALVVQDFFGGEILRCVLNKKGDTHYWNIIDGVGVDLTSDQFGGDGFHPVFQHGHEHSRAMKLYPHTDTVKRYADLIIKLSELMAGDML